MAFQQISHRMLAIWSTALLLSSVSSFLHGNVRRCSDLGFCNYKRAVLGDIRCFAKARKKENKKSAADDDEMDEDNFDGFSDDVKQLLLSAKDISAEAESNLISLDENKGNSDDHLEYDESESDDDLRQYVQEITGMLADMDDSGSADIDFVTNPDDIVGDDEDEEDALVPTAVTSNDWKEKVQKIIHEVIGKQGLYVQKIFWVGGRVEVVISASADPMNPIGPSVSALQVCHRSMYDEFELREEELAVVTKFEIVVASPGIGETLRTDQDFVSFKGFNVAVTTTEIYKKKTVFEGTLVERTDENVCISLKGRIVKVPRDLVLDVRLPKPKYESTDTEMRKLR